MELTDEQWSVIEPLFAAGKSGAGNRGRPRRGNREVLEGILWVLRTGARWKDLPPEFPPYRTCHRRFGEWVAGKVLDSALKALVADMESRGGIDLSEAFIDGTFAGAKRGAVALVQQSEAKGPRSWKLRTAMVFLSPFASKVLRRMK